MRSAPTLHLQGGDSGELAVFDLGRRALDQGVFIGTVRRLQHTPSRSSQAQNSGYLRGMERLTGFLDIEDHRDLAPGHYHAAADAATPSFQE
jgi:hypothetical protein